MLKLTRLCCKLVITFDVLPREKWGLNDEHHSGYENEDHGHLEHARTLSGHASVEE